MITEAREHDRQNPRPGRGRGPARPGTNKSTPLAAVIQPPVTPVRYPLAAITSPRSTRLETAEEKSDVVPGTRSIDGLTSAVGPVDASTVIGASHFAADAQRVLLDPPDHHYPATTDREHAGSRHPERPRVANGP